MIGLAGLPGFDDAMCRELGLVAGVDGVRDLGFPVEEVGTGWWAVAEPLRVLLAPDVPADPRAVGRRRARRRAARRSPRHRRAGPQLDRSVPARRCPGREDGGARGRTEPEGRCPRWLRVGRRGGGAARRAGVAAHRPCPAARWPWPGERAGGDGHGVAPRCPVARAQRAALRAGRRGDVGQPAPGSVPGRPRAARPRLASDPWQPTGTSRGAAPPGVRADRSGAVCAGRVGSGRAAVQRVRRGSVRERTLGRAVTLGGRQDHLQRGDAAATWAACHAVAMAAFVVAAHRGDARRSMDSLRRLEDHVSVEPRDRWHRVPPTLPAPRSSPSATTCVWTSRSSSR